MNEMALVYSCRNSHFNLPRAVIINVVVILCLGFLFYGWKFITFYPEKVIKNAWFSRFPGNFMNDPSDPSQRWVKGFHDIFDTPHPLSFRVRPDNAMFKDKYLIYRCDNDTMSFCGGWGNQAKGMITAYLLANLTGRVFKSEIIMPECDFQRFWVPNHVNWSLPTSFHKKIIPGKKVKMMDMMSKYPFYDEFSQTDWVHAPEMNSDFVYMKSDFDMVGKFRDSKFYAKELQWMQGQDTASLNRFLFTHLLRPTSYLQDRVVKFLEKHVGTNEKLLCINFRLGKNPRYPKETGFTFSHLWKLMKIIREVVLPRLDGKVKIFLMTDSQKIIGNVQKQDFGKKAFVSPGKKVHVELPKDATYQEKCDSFEKVLFEQLVLLQCDGIILSDSSISRMSAYLRSRNDDLYCYLREGATVPCEANDLKMIYRTRG